MLLNFKKSGYILLSCSHYPNLNCQSLPPLWNLVFSSFSCLTHEFILSAVVQAAALASVVGAADSVPSFELYSILGYRPIPECRAATAPTGCAACSGAAACQRFAGAAASAGSGYVSQCVGGKCMLLLIGSLLAPISASSGQDGGAAGYTAYAVAGSTTLRWCPLDSERSKFRTAITTEVTPSPPTTRG